MARVRDVLSGAFLLVSLSTERTDAWADAVQCSMLVTHAANALLPAQDIYRGSLCDTYTAPHGQKLSVYSQEQEKHVKNQVGRWDFSWC